MITAQQHRAFGQRPYYLRLAHQHPHHGGRGTGTYLRRVACGHEESIDVPPPEATLTIRPLAKFFLLGVTTFANAG
jgi:hypothetical protein